MGKRSGNKLITEALDYFQGAKGKRGRTSRANTKKMDHDKLTHALIGEERPGRPSGNGYHYRPGGNDFDGRRLRPNTEQPLGGKGVYQAEPEYLDGDQWKPKGGNNGVSTFFPKDWTPKEVDSGIASAFRKSKPDPASPNMWVGEHNGVKITGYYDNANGRGYTHGFPSAVQPQ